MKKVIALIGLLFAGGWAMGQLRITEICPRPGVADANGKESGWIELTNTSATETVNLSDYALIRFNRGKKDKEGNRLALLSQEVGPGERFVVYASESYANFEDIGGSGKVEMFGDLMVYPVKINPKKYPTVRLYKGSELVDTFEVPVDLADGKSFAPGQIRQMLLDEATPYDYRLSGEEVWQTAGSGCLAVVADREMAPVPGSLAVTFTPDSEAFSEGTVVAGNVARMAWDLSSNTGKNTGLTAPADTLAEATEAYAVAFWFKAKSVVGSDEEENARVLFDYRPKSVDDKSGVIVVLTSEGQLRVQARNAARKVLLDMYCDMAVDYGDDTWHHVALSIGRKQGDRLRLWADGEKCIDTTLTFDIPLRTDVPLCFGRAYDSTSWGLFNGALSDIRLYPRALEAAEAVALFGEDGAVREITGTLTKAETIAEADGLYSFPDTLANATSAQLYSQAAAPTLAAAGETVDLWLNPSTLTPSKGNPIVLVDARSGNNSTDGFVLVADSTGALKIERKGTQQEWTNLGLTLEAGAWVHLTLAYNAQSGECTCYRNGVAVGTFSAVNSYQPPTGNHYFGSSRDDYWSAFKGLLAAPRLFSGVLCAEEVARLHNASPLAAEVGKVFTQGLVEGVQTALPVEALAPVEAQVGFALSDLAATGQLTVTAEVVGGSLAVTLDGQAIEVGTAIAAPVAGEHTLAWVLTPEAEATYATVNLAAQVVFETSSTSRTILANPTPGVENNLTGAVSYGPNIGPEVGSGREGMGVTAAPLAAPGAAYAVAYEIHPLSTDAGNVIASVTLLYRADFGEVQEAEMAYNEATGLWEGTIPAEDLPAEGHLLRYAARITDGDGNRWRSPSFCNPNDGYEWFGTIVKGEANTDETLQTFHLFADSTALANMDKQYDAISGSLPLGARVGVFDEQSNTYYDNVRIDLRGNTSAGFNKKSHGLRFNKCQPLTCTNPFDGEEIEVRKTSFIAEYCDPIYIRQALSFWLLRQAGNLTPFDYPVRLQLNGEFYQLAFHSNRFTDELIEDYYGFGEKDGSVGYGYKNVGPFSGSNTATAIEKKTPDDGNEKDINVLQAFTATLPSATVTEANQAQVTGRVVEAFDLPAWVNYLAAARVTQEADDIWANLSGYYDNLHTDTWMPLAYDLNLSFGQWYFGDDEATGRIGLRATDDTFKSHPLYGGFKIRAHKQSGFEVGVGNCALEALFQNEKFRRLYLRRLRTLMDGYLKAPDAAQDATPLWQQALRYKEAIAHLAEQDRTKWAYSSQATGTKIWVWPSALSLEEGFTDLWDNYIVPRRKHLYETHAVGSATLPEGYGAAYAAGIPAAQSALDTLAPNFSFANARSTDGSEPGFSGDCLIIRNDNDEAVDMSGWTLSGAVVWALPAGTVVDANDSLTIVADRKAYVATLTNEAKAAAPVILGNATFSEAALDLTLTAAGTTVCSASWAPPTAEKQFLRVVEVYANTADNGGDGTEYILLKNISESEILSLANIRLTSQKRGSSPKVDITLAGGTLAPGETYRLEKAAFASAGWDKIANGKVDMFLYDSVGALIQSIGFTSSGAADGGGASMVTEKTDATLVDADWAPSFELPTAEGTTAAEVTAAIAETPAIGSWIAALDAEAKAALTAFSGSANDLTTCYLVNLPPQAAPEVEIAVTEIAFDEAGNLCIKGALEVAGSEREGRVNGTVHLETFADLGGEATEHSLDLHAFPVTIDSLPEGARFFRLRLR